MGVDLLVGTQKGALILRSDSAEGPWRRDPLRLKGWLVTAFTRDAAGRTYAGVTHDVYGTAVMASDDLETWEQLEGAPRYAASEVGNAAHNRIIGAMDPMGQYTAGGRHVDQIWKLLAVGDLLYAGVSEAGIFRSGDRGKSWQVLRGLNEHPDRDGWGPGFGGLCAHSLLVDAQDPKRIWVGISSVGALRSEDGGESFVGSNEGVSSSGEGWCVHALAHDPQNAEVIYRQDHRGVYKTSNGGGTWQLIEKGLPESELGDDHICSFGFAIALDPASQSVFVVPMEGDSFRYPHDGRLTVYRSQNGGESWQGFRSGLPEDCYTNVLRQALAVDQRDPCGVYFGTTSGSVYASGDRGESWSRVAADLPKVLSVEVFGN